MKAGSGKHTVFLEEKEIGNEVLLTLYGGEKPHIGVIVVAEPGKETKVFKTEERHKDDIVAVPIAEKKRDSTNKKVVCIAGIHVENATSEDINTIVQNCKDIEKEV
jgi:hypothetical protein